MLGVASADAECGEMVVAIDEHRAVEVGDAIRIRGADQRVEREGRRAVAARESVDERPDSGGLLRDGHGLIGLIGGRGTMDFGLSVDFGAFFPFVVLSVFGSMYTPEIESTFVTVDTLDRPFLFSNAIVI